MLRLRVQGSPCGLLPRPIVSDSELGCERRSPTAVWALRRGTSPGHHALQVGGVRWGGALVCFARVPVFSLAVLWEASAPPLEAGAALAGAARRVSASRPPEIRVALLEDRACAEVRLELTHYPRTLIAGLVAEVEHSGGTFLELWRLPKSERDAFRASFLPSTTTRLHRSVEEAARSIREHLERIAAAVPAGGEVAAASRLHEPPPSTLARLRLVKKRRVDAAPAPARPAPEELRVAPRYDVSLQVEFRTEAEFLHEHATNISRGGLFIRTRMRPELDSVVIVTVLLPTGERIQGEAVVVHVREGDEGGVGLAFLSEDRRFSESLDRYLAQLEVGREPE